MPAGPILGRTVGLGARHESPPRVRLELIAALTAAAVIITAGITAVSAPVTSGASGGAAALQALGRGLIVGVPLAVALYACGRPAHARFGKQLLAISALWWLASLSNSSSPLLYSIGRIAGWLTDLGLIYVVLAFPGAALRTRFERGLVTCATLVVATLYLPTALLVSAYPQPSPWSSCSIGCPHNAFMALSSQPGIVDGLIAPVRETVTALLFVIVSGVLARRIRDADPLVRRTLSPVLVVAIVRLLAFTAAIVARRVAPSAPATEAAAWLVALTMPAFAIAFLIGLVRWHLFVAAGIRTVNARLPETPDPEQVQELLATAFEDPALQIASWSGTRGAWIAAAGEPVRLPAPDSERWLTELRTDDRPVVAIVHDATLRDDPAFIAAAAAAASVAFANDRVANRTAGIVRELRDSRARILAAADSERRRIERDLHDGAQQRLVVLGIHLMLAAERAEQDAPEEAAALRELAGEADQALEEIRSLTHGIYPATLLEQGLATAVRSAALRSPVPASVEVVGLGEYPRAISTAVYFCCVEALQNVAKHAPAASSVRIVLREANSVLCFSVSDDGPGMPASGARIGAGVINMRDRVTTVGGQLTVQSTPHRGTRVSGQIPLSTGATVETGHSPRIAQRSRRRDHAAP